MKKECKNRNWTVKQLITNNDNADFNLTCFFELEETEIEKCLRRLKESLQKTEDSLNYIKITHDIAQNLLNDLKDEKYRLSSMKWKFEIVKYNLAPKGKIFIIDVLNFNFSGWIKVIENFETKKQAKTWIANFTRVNNITDYKIL